jgi:hypothetical protein
MRRFLIVATVISISFLGWRTWQLLNEEPVFGNMPYHRIEGADTYEIPGITSSIENGIARAELGNARLGCIQIWSDRKLERESQSIRRVIEVIFQKQFPEHADIYERPPDYEMTYLRYDGISGALIDTSFQHIRRWPSGMKPAVYSRPLKVRNFKQSFDDATSLFIERCKPILSARRDFTIRQAQLFSMNGEDRWVLIGSTEFTKLEEPNPLVVGVVCHLDAASLEIRSFNITGTPTYIQQWKHLNVEAEWLKAIDRNDAKHP